MYVVIVIIKNAMRNFSVSASSSRFLIIICDGLGQGVVNYEPDVCINTNCYVLTNFKFLKVAYLVYLFPYLHIDDNSYEVNENKFGKK